MQTRWSIRVKSAGHCGGRGANDEIFAAIGRSGSHIHSGKAWQSTNITLLGDAIHTMTPLQGLGGSTALRDAGLVRREFVKTDRGECSPIEAINAYEKAIIEYGFAAVRRSIWFGRVVISDNRLLRAAFKAALLMGTRIPWLKRRMFRLPL